MPGSQIATSVTILNSMKGFQAVSLTEYNTSAEAAIAAGSVCEIAGAFFTFLADEPINAASWTAIVTGTTAYITLTPSGAAPAQIIDVAYTATAPVWRDDLQGWYATAASNIRVVGSVYKAEAANYANKIILSSLKSVNWSEAFNVPLGSGWATITARPVAATYVYQNTVERITSGSGNWTVPAGVYRIRVTCVGGGGGGGGSAYYTASIWLTGATGATGSNTTFAGATTGSGALGGVGGSNNIPGRGGSGNSSAGSGGGSGDYSRIGGNGGGAGGRGGASSTGEVGNVGGGGGGGGGSASGYSGGGGGGGTNISNVISSIISVTPGALIAYSVGAGGGGGATGAGGNAGGAGGSGIIIIEY